MQKTNINTRINVEEYLARAMKTTCLARLAHLLHLEWLADFPYRMGYTHIITEPLQGPPPALPPSWAMAAGLDGLAGEERQETPAMAQDVA